VRDRFRAGEGNVDTGVEPLALRQESRFEGPDFLSLSRTEGPPSPRTMERNFAACLSHANERRYRSRPRAPRAPASPDEQASRIAAFTSSGRTSEIVQPHGPSRTIGAIAG